MSDICGNTNAVAFYAVTITAILSHARGTLLLLRAVVTWLRLHVFHRRHYTNRH